MQIDRWSHVAAQNLGWEPWIIPLVPFHAVLSPKSSLKQKTHSKAPGTLGRDGEWAGRDFRQLMRGNDFKEADEQKCGIGAACRGGLTAFDADEGWTEELLDAALELFETHIGSVYVRIGQAGRALAPFFIEGVKQGDVTPTPGRFIARMIDDAGKTVEPIAFEFLSTQFAAHAIHPVTEKPYEWFPYSPFFPDSHVKGTDGPDALPKAPVSKVNDFIAALTTMLATHGYEVKSAMGGAARWDGTSRYTRENKGDRAPTGAAKVARLLEFLPNAGCEAFDTREAWLKIGLALYRACDTGVAEDYEIGKAAWGEWSRQRPQTPEDYPEDRWESFKNLTHINLGYSYLTNMVRKHTLDRNSYAAFQFEDAPPFDPKDFEGYGDPIGKQAEEAASEAAQLERESLMLALHNAAPVETKPVTLPTVWHHDMTRPEDKAVLLRQVTDVTARGTLTQLAAAPAVGKSIWTLLHALAISTERPELCGSKKLRKPGTVVIVNNEDTKEAEYNRICAAMELHGLTEADLKHPIVVHQHRVTFFEKSGYAEPKLSNSGKDFIQALIDIRKRYQGVALIVFDTLSSICSGLEENSATEMTFALNFLNDLAVAADAAILFTHHTAKSNFKVTGPGVGRGSSAIGGSVRGVVALNYPEATEIPVGSNPVNWLKQTLQKGSYQEQIPQALWLTIKSVVLDATDYDTGELVPVSSGAMAVTVPPPIEEYSGKAETFDILADMVKPTPVTRRAPATDLPEAFKACNLSVEELREFSRDKTYFSGQPPHHINSLGKLIREAFMFYRNRRREDLDFETARQLARLLIKKGHSVKVDSKSGRLVLPKLAPPVMIPDEI